MENLALSVVNNASVSDHCSDCARPAHSRKHLASTSPSFPVAVSGSVSPSEAPAHMGKFWFRHHCFVHDRQGFEGLSGMSRCNIV